MTLHARTPKFPTEEAAKQAANALRSLERLAPLGEAVKVRLVIEGADVKADALVPRAALELLLDALSELARGNAATIVPVYAELTTQEAADLLNVSRPFLVGLLKEGRIPYRKVGAHRRIRAADLMRYRQEDDAERAALADELTREAQDLGLDY